ncbi:hypothetical protein D3C72_663730 [compost metagenome]
MPGGQRRVGPPAVLAVLGEGAGKVAVQLVVRILCAGFQLLPVHAAGQAQAPCIVQAVAAAQGQVVAAAIAAGRAALAVEVQVLGAGGNEGLPLANCLPGCLPLVAQFVLVGTQAGVGHFREQGQFPGGGDNRIGVVGNQLLAGDGRVHRVVEQQLGRVWRGAVDAVHRVFHAAFAAVAGADQVLAAGQAELLGAGQRFAQQHGDVQRNDFGIDLPQLAEQGLVERAG